LGWHFDITKSSAVASRPENDRFLPKPWIEVAQKIELHKETASRTLSKNPFIIFPVTEHFPVHSVEMRRTWEFTIRDSHYNTSVSDVCKFQQVAQKHGAIQFQALQLTSRHWAVDVTSPEWPTTLLSTDCFTDPGLPVYEGDAIQQFLDSDRERLHEKEKTRKRGDNSTTADSQKRNESSIQFLLDKLELIKNIALNKGLDGMTREQNKKVGLEYSFNSPENSDDSDSEGLYCSD
jgi:hypothetical protein